MSVFQAFHARDIYELLKERDDPVPHQDRVTVVIPCYNQQEWLIDALDSVLKQTVLPHAVIVIDDGSTIPIIYPRQLPPTPTQIVRVTNRGLPSARNTGLMLTRTEAFLPLDADDWLEPTYIEKTLALFKDADVVVPGLQEHGPTRNSTFMPGYDRPLHEVTLDVMWEFNRTFYCSLFRTELLKSIGGYNGRMIEGFEDYDMAIDLMNRGARYVACNEILFNYRTRPDSMLVSAMSKQMLIKEEMRRHHRM